MGTEKTAAAAASVYPDRAAGDHGLNLAGLLDVLDRADDPFGSRRPRPRRAVVHRSPALRMVADRWDPLRASTPHAVPRPGAPRTTPSRPVPLRSVRPAPPARIPVPAPVRTAPAAEPMGGPPGRAARLRPTRRPLGRRPGRRPPGLGCAPAPPGVPPRHDPACGRPTSGRPARGAARAAQHSHEQARGAFPCRGHRYHRSARRAVGPPGNGRPSTGAAPGAPRSGPEPGPLPGRHPRFSRDRSGPRFATVVAGPRLNARGALRHPAAGRRPPLRDIARRNRPPDFPRVVATAAFGPTCTPLAEPRPPPGPSRRCTSPSAGPASPYDVCRLDRPPSAPQRAVPPGRRRPSADAVPASEDPPGEEIPGPTGVRAPAPSAAAARISDRSAPGRVRATRNRPAARLCGSRTGGSRDDRVARRRTARRNRTASAAASADRPVRPGPVIH